ncbi:MAG: HEPN domain-containing protein [Bacillota bacterium]
MNYEENKAPLISYRLTQAKESLEDAKKLAEHQGSPRSIANRAYYAMFYAVQALLLTIGKGSSRHSGVISLFDLHFVKTGIFSKEHSKTLHYAFEVRQQGDYGEMVEIESEDAGEILRSAGEFLGAVQTYLEAEQLC